MKMIPVVILVAVLMAAYSHAEDIKALPASQGTVMFPHKHHQEVLKDCLKCHEKGPGKIAELGKEWAHKTCKGCHSKMERGPVECKGCHKK